MQTNHQSQSPWSVTYTACISFADQSCLICPQVELSALTPQFIVDWSKKLMEMLKSVCVPHNECCVLTGLFPPDPQDIADNPWTV